MSSLEDFVASPGAGAGFHTAASAIPAMLPASRGFEEPSQATLAELDAIRMSGKTVQFDPYPPKRTGAAIFSLGRVQFSLEHPLKVLLCNSQVLLFLLVPVEPLPNDPPQLVRIDLAQPSVVDTIALSIPSLFPSGNPARGQQALATTIYGVYCDPTGRHVLLSLRSGENYYVSLSPASINQQRVAAHLAARRGGRITALSPAIRLLPKFKGLLISSVGWHFTSYHGAPASSTREIIIGTSTGALYATLIVDHHGQDTTSDLSITAAFARMERSTPDRYLKLLYSLPDSSAASDVTGIWWDAWYQHTGQNQVVKWAIAIVTTSSRLYQFVDSVGFAKVRREDDENGGILERLFGSYQSNRIVSKSLELPAPDQMSEMRIYQPATSRKASLERDESCPTPLISWLTGAGIYHGEVPYTISQAGDGVISSSQLTPFPPLEPVATSPSAESKVTEQFNRGVGATTPLSFASTEYHFVLLYNDRIRIICRLDGRLVHEELLSLKPGERVIALASDPVHHTYWVYSSESIFELVVKNEDRDIWKVFLARRDFELALQFAKNENRDQVLVEQADSYLQQDKCILAAQIYAQCSKSFEEVVISFVDRGERDALRYYLISRLERLGRQNLTERMMLATWLTEIYLAKINELEDMVASASSQEEAANVKAEQHLVEDELQQFLRTYKNHLDLRTTYDLIASHGRKDVMVYYANLMGDHERIIRHYILEEDWKKAIEIMSRQDNLEHYYRFASVLVKNDAKSATAAFMRQPRLDVRRLIPALIPSRWTGPRRQDTLDGDNAEIVIEYLKFVTSRLNNCDSAVHNALVTLYASQPQADEGALLRFLATTSDSPYTGRPYYDLDYALRLCKRNNKLQSCGLIYGKMGLYESSVDLALQTGDLELAKINADKPEDDLLLRKKLWLKIAQYVVHHQKDIKAAMMFLDSTELLKIEDILPFFPDFVVIDDFKQDICDALDHYSVHIQKLKQDMEESNRSTELIKSDLSKLSSRFLIINQNDECSSCQEKLTSRQFYLFPCQHSFHADCLIKEVTQHMPPHQLRRILTLQTKLSQFWRSDRAVANDVSSLLSDSKKLAMASVQGLDQVRKLIIPDTLVEIIGGGVGVIGSGVGALGGVLPIPRVAKLRKATTSDDLEVTSSDDSSALRRGSPSSSNSAAPRNWGSGPCLTMPSSSPLPGLQPPSLGSSLRKTKEGQKLMTDVQKWKEELDELLASKCALCEWALNSIDKDLVGEGETDI